MPSRSLDNLWDLSGLGFLFPTVTAPGNVLVRTQELGGRAEALVPAAWPLVLACPELKRLDLQGRGADRQPVGLNFMERAQGKCESCKESEGGRRRQGAWHRGPMGGSEEEKGQDRGRGRENLENKQCLHAG